MKSLKIALGARVVLLLSAMLLAVAPRIATGGVPQLINFQGQLKNSGGGPLANDTLAVEFKLYDDAVSGNVKWSEIDTVITDANGLFTILLGRNNPVPDSAFNDSLRWLGIKVGSDAEISPRTQQSALGYVYRVSTVDGATGGTITSKVSIGPGHTNWGTNAFVAGENNTAYGNWAVVAGGIGNFAAQSNSTVGGGGFDTASYFFATVGGGNTNTAGGFASTVPGGAYNKALGDYSFAAGRRAKADHAGTFVWADKTDADFSSTGPNQFLIRAVRVGIGTNSPDKLLQIGDDAVIGSEGMIRLESRSFSGSGNLRDWEIGVPQTGDVTTGKGYSFVIDDVILGTNPEFMVQWGTGNVGIGTLSPVVLLHVAGAAGNNTGVWSNLSDRRLKKDIEPIQNALETVEGLKPVTFRWKDEKKDAQFGRVRGLIAQDVEKVIPEWIKADPDGYKRIEPIGVDALLIEAIKEQQKQIEELQAEIAKLKTQPYQAQVER